MFDGELFSMDDAVAFACGFLGGHPYNFVATATPERTRHFNFVRSRVERFLTSNTGWRTGISTILEAASVNSEISMRIFNPMNFFGMLTDLSKHGKTSRISNLQVVEDNSGNKTNYFGTVIWNGKLSRLRFEQAIGLYPSESIALMRSANQWLNEYDDSIFRKFGITHELFRHTDGGVDWLNLGQDPPRWQKSDKDLKSLDKFFRAHDFLIDATGKYFGDHSASLG
jgi:hypothetical protein